MAAPIVHPSSELQTATIIFLHGLGDSGHGWSSISSEMKLPWCKFIFPNAPNRPITFNGGATMPGWFDITSLSETAEDDEDGFRQTHAFVSELIEKEIAAGIPSDRIIIGGFSQGAAQSVYTTTRFPKPLGGCICLSGWLALRSKYPSEVAEVNKNIPIFVGHGTMDPLVRFSHGEASANILKSMGFPVEFHQYPIGHTASPKEMDEMKAFLHARLPRMQLPLPENLDTMSVHELKQLMASRKINMAGCIEKSDMLQRIRESQQ